MLRFVPVGAVVGADGGRPRSRSLPPAAVFGSASGWRFYDAAQCAPVLRHCHFRGKKGLSPFLSLVHVYPDAEGKIERRGNDAALPRGGKGALQVCGGDAVCPCGAKALQSGAPGFGGVAGESRKSGRFAHQERLAGAPGGRGISDAGMRATPLQPFCADKIQRSAPFARPVSHAVPQGERRALPAPAQGINPLRIPFWGRQPFPQNAAGGRPLLMGLPPSTPATPQPNRNAATPPHS